MWKQFFDMARELLLLTERAQKNRNDLTLLQKEFKDFVEKSEAGFQVQKQINERLVFELKRTNERLDYELQRMTTNSIARGSARPASART
ncbi:MAG: hypothetical protein ABI977_38125 [Acidobacteriota bacterium]